MLWLTQSALDANLLNYHCKIDICFSPCTQSGEHISLLASFSGCCFRNYDIFEEISAVLSRNIFIASPLSIDGTNMLEKI